MPGRGGGAGGLSLAAPPVRSLPGPGSLGARGAVEPGRQTALAAAQRPEPLCKSWDLI